MKNKLPRKYKITCSVRRSDAPENIVSLRYVGMHNRNVGRLYQADNNNRRKVRRFDAPENIVSLRDAGMYNGVANDTKMAETLVLSGFAGGGGGQTKTPGGVSPQKHKKKNFKTNNKKYTNKQI